MTSCQYSRGIRVFIRMSGLFILLTTIAIAQSTLGTIVGRVVDPSSAGVSGVNVTLRDEGTNVASSQNANADGQYVFSNIKPAMYQLTFEANGFAAHTVEHLALEVNQTVRQDVNLKLCTCAAKC